LIQNTIFQFFVATDRLYLVKVGSALNQLPQVLQLARGPDRIVGSGRRSFTGRR
jgi:hypothetical protein